MYRIFKFLRYDSYFMDFSSSSFCQQGSDITQIEVQLQLKVTDTVLAEKKAIINDNAHVKMQCTAFNSLSQK